VLLVCVSAVGLGLVPIAQGERSQYGSLVLSLGGQLSPLALPRQRAAPVAVRLEGSLRTSDGSPLPRVGRVELGLPSQGIFSTAGLPTCTQRRLRVTSSEDALAACRSALVGRGRVDLTVQVPNQDPFAVHTRLLAFNGRMGRKQAILLHAFTTNPPLAVVLPFRVLKRRGRFGTALVATLPALGEWARVAKFKMLLFRRYRYQGRQRSVLSASCPIPKRWTAGFFSFARMRYTLGGGRRVSVAITRGCRGR
jgi:hypothetical protein